MAKKDEEPKKEEKVQEVQDESEAKEEAPKETEEAPEAKKTEKKSKEPKEKSEELPGVDSKGSLVPLDTYLAAGIHIGTQRRVKDMAPFIYKIRPDGLSVLDVSTIDKRIRSMSNFLAQYTPEKIVVVCARDVGKKPAQKFAEVIGATPKITRFMPGSLTNPSYEDFSEPDVLFVVDPGADKQAIHEALNMNIPIASLCDTNNQTQNIDVILPVNNKGKKSLALVFWLLSREVLKKQGKIKNDADFDLKVEDFEEEAAVK